jgi:DNA-directed RNA polymerase subunit omega
MSDFKPVPPGDWAGALGTPFFCGERPSKVPRSRPKTGFGIAVSFGNAAAGNNLFLQFRDDEDREEDKEALGPLHRFLKQLLANWYFFCYFYDCVQCFYRYFTPLVNSEYIKQALAKVGNPNVLVNLISRRVRQLTSGGGNSRTLIESPGTLGAADLALLEIIEGKMGFNATLEPEDDESLQPKRKRR